MPYIQQSKNSSNRTNRIFINYQLEDGSIISYNVHKQSTLISRFSLIFDFVNKMLEDNEELKKYYEDFLKEMNTNKTMATASKYIPTLFSMIDKDGARKGYHNFTYTPPRKKQDAKGYINEHEYNLIMKSSLRSKFICAMCIEMRENNNMSIVKYIYGELLKEMISEGTLYKLERVIESTVNSISSNGFNHRSQLWVVFSSGKGIDPQNIALRERNNVLYKGLATIDPGKDPIKWLVSMVRTSVRYLMKDKITQVNIAVSQNTIESVENSNDKLLKMFIYETVISNRQLYKLIEEMPFGNKLISEYVTPITYTIAAPFISLVFSMPNLNVNRLSNPALINLLTYKFLKQIEPDWQIINLLKCKAISKRISKEDIENDKEKEYSKKYLSVTIKKVLTKLKFSSYSTYTDKQLEQIFRESIQMLYRYDYIDYDNIRINIYPEVLITEYITYIFNLSTGIYNHQIELAKNFLLDKVSNPEEIR